MRILQVITRLIQGGAQQNTILACRELVRLGHEVHLAYGPIYGPEGSLLDTARQNGAELIELPALRRAVLPVHDLLAYRQIRRLIRRVRPDIVHTHASKAGILGRAAAWGEAARSGRGVNPGTSNAAIVHTVHGLPFHGRQSALVRAAYIRAERFAAHRCHKIIGVTQAMVDAFLAHGIGRPEQFTVIPNGLDLDQFIPTPDARTTVRKQWNIPLDVPVVGIVARLDRLKGHDDLLDIMPQLLQRQPELRLLFIGDGWHRRALESRIARENWRERVIFTGLISAGRVPDALAAMDVMALPSYQEGQGRTLAEALLCGCGIVGYDVGGIGAICVEGQTGRLVKAGERPALAATIIDLLEDVPKRQKLVEQGRQRVRARFDYRVTTRQLIAVYEELRAAAEQPPRKGV